MNLLLLSRNFYQLFRYIHHAVAWCQVLFHAICAVACYLVLWHVVCYSELSCGVLFCHVFCCHLTFSPLCSRCWMPSHVVVACSCVSSSASECCQRLSSAIPCCCRNKHLRVCILNCYFQKPLERLRRWKYYESAISDHLRMIKKFVRPGWSSCELLWLLSVPYGIVLHLPLPPYYIHSCILTSQLSLPSQVSCCWQQLAQLLQGMNDPTRAFIK